MSGWKKRQVADKVEQDMARDDIIRMAREAGIPSDKLYHPNLERFAQLVAAAEREACADLAETYFDPMWAEHDQAANEIAKAIRARGNSEAV